MNDEQKAAKNKKPVHKKSLVLDLVSYHNRCSRFVCIKR